MISPGLPYADGIWTTRRGRRGTTGRPRRSTGSVHRHPVGGRGGITNPASRSVSTAARWVRTSATTAEQARRPRPARPRPHLSAHQAAGAGLGLHLPHSWFVQSLLRRRWGQHHEQGAGTVLATVGVGGVGLYDVNASDTEAGYLGRSPGQRNPTSGLLDVRATADQLEARFVPVAGGAFTDSFVIRRGLPPAAEPGAGRGVRLVGHRPDSRVRRGQSRDSDGTLGNYAWTFGDGAREPAARCSTPTRRRGPTR